MTAPFRPAPNGQGFPGQQPQFQQQQQQPQAPQGPPQPQVPYTQNIMPEPAYTMPVPQMPQPQPQYQQNPQQQYQQQPQYQPAWQGGQQIPQQQPQYPGQQPQQPVQQPQRQQAPGQQIQFDQQGRMFGSGLPQELQGKTMAEAVGMYGVMRQYAVQNQAQQQPPQRQQQPALQQQQGRPNFFADPEGAIERAIERKLAPVLEQTTQTQITEARNAVAQLHPQQFAQYEGEVLQRLHGLPAETLANPAAWRMALQQVVGEKAMQGQLQQPVPQPQPQQQWQQTVPPQMQPRMANPLSQYPQQQQAPQPQQQQQQNWVPATPQFFTESPSAVMYPGGDPAMGGPNGMQLTAQQQEVARRFGYSNEQYIQGMGARY